MNARRFQILLLIVACAIRLYHFDFPVAGFQAWRQADTAAIARNFYEHGYTFASPQSDWGGNSPGYVETEFPVYPFLVALLYGVLGVADAWGRILTIICAAMAAVGLFRLTRHTVNERTAMWAAGIYAILPLNIFYGRAFMPDFSMLMCSVWGLYFFALWIDSDRWAHWLLAALSIALAILIKIPSLYIGLPLLYLAWTKYGWGLFKRWTMWLFALATLAPAALWYWHAYHIYLSSGLSFGIWFAGQDKWGIFGPLLTLKFYNDVFFKSIAERHLTYAGFIPFVVGLFLKRSHKLERLFDWWLIAFLVYVAVVTVGNQVHEYYQLPVVLPACVFIAKTFDRVFHTGPLWGRSGWKARYTYVLALCLMLIPVLSFLRVANFMKGERWDSSILQLAEAVNRYTDPQNLVVAVDQGDPVVLYRTNRKGWHAFACTISDEFLRQRAQEGARYVIGETGGFSRDGCVDRLVSLQSAYPVVDATADYFILDLRARFSAGATVGPRSSILQR